MEGYRVYILGPDGHVQNRIDIICDDEAEAIRLAKQLVDGHDVELWHLGRLVETFRPRRKGSFNLDQGLPLGIPSPLGMNSPDEKPPPSAEEAKPPPVITAFRRMLEDFAKDLRAIIAKLRRKLN
jgi:hypothetical protein